MCIIIAKKKNGRIPTESELRNSFEYNSDGAGFMYVDNNKVVIDKGYMTLDSFLKHYKSLCIKYDDFKNKSLVIHCRIGTSGKNNKGNTHPYPITDNVKKLRTRHLQENIGIAHNGIIHGYGTATGLNDTQEYISKYLYPLYYHYRDFYKNDDMLYNIKQATSSKFVILDKTDELYFIGEFIEDKGLYFSNTTYKDYEYIGLGRYSGYNSYIGYDEDWYISQYNKQREEEEKEYKENTIYSENEVDEYCLLPLQKDWWIDMYGNGHVERVKSRNYYYDYETLELYEKVDSGYRLIAENPIVYDENGEEI